MPMMKALGSGFPLLRTMYDEDLDVWGPGGHTGTFRGFNPAMRASIRAIEYIQHHDLLAHARELGEFIQKRLSECEANNDHIGEAWGKGLFVGIELITEEGEPASDLLETVRTTCYENGVIVWAGGRGDNVILLLPPLVMTESQAKTGIAILIDVIESATDG